MIAPVKTALPLPTTDIVLLPETPSPPEASEPSLGTPQSSFEMKTPSVHSLTCSAQRLQSHPNGEDASPTNEAANEHSLTLLPRIFLMHSFGENLGELLSKGVEHFFRQEVLIRETPRLVPEETMVSFDVLHPDDDPNMPCTVLRSPSGEIGVLCESKRDSK